MQERQIQVEKTRLTSAEVFVQDPKRKGLTRVDTRKLFQYFQDWEFCLPEGLTDEELKLEIVSRAVGEQYVVGNTPNFSLSSPSELVFCHETDVLVSNDFIPLSKEEKLTTALILLGYSTE